MSLTFRKDFIASQNLVSQVGPNVVLTRAGDEGTQVNSSGWIEKVLANVPRFTHDPVTKALKGLLLESTARTNICPYGDDLTQWTTEDATVDANATVAPDGNTTADRINVDATNARHGVFIPSSAAASAAQPYVVSAFFEDDGCGYCVLSAGNSSDWFGAIFNLSTQAVEGSTVGTTGAYTAAGVEDWGGGRYRMWVAGTFGSTTSKNSFLCPAESASPTISFGRPSYLATAGKDIFAWGANLIASKKNESFIFNTGAGFVGRGAEGFSTSDLSFYNQNEGTFYFKGWLEHPELQENGLPAFYEGANYRLRMRANVGGTLLALVNPNPAGDSWVAGGTESVSNDTQFQAVISCAEDDGDLFLDGVLSASDSTLDVPWPADIFQTNIPGVDDFHGIIEEMRYYNTKVDDAVGLDMSNGIFPAEAGVGSSGVGLAFGKMGMR